MIDLLFNLLPIPAHLWMLHRLWRKPRWQEALGYVLGALAYLLSAFVLAGGGIFMLMRLTCWLLFLHLPAALLVIGLLHYARHRLLATYSVVSALVLMSVGVDAFFIEPHWLEVTRYTIASPKLSQTYRIVVLADLQIDEVDAHTRQSLERAMLEQPDLLLLPGDYLQTDLERLPELRMRFRSLLHEVGFSATQGIFAVEGNVDWRGDWQSIWEGFEVTTFPYSATVSSGELNITGLTLKDSFDTRLKVASSQGYHIVLGHGPDFALGDVQADLLIAGHTHGGQVRLPLFGPPFTLSKVPRAWAAGRTELPGARTLVVSRGIGLERANAPRLRFLCRPELVVITLTPAI